MAKSETRRGIDALRESAGSIEIGPDDDSGRITDFITFDKRFLVVKNGGIYEVQLADQIDPERTNVNVPDAHQCLIRYGEDSEFISRTLLTANILIDENYLRSGVSRDQLMPIVLTLTVKFAEIQGLIQSYIAQESAALATLERPDQEIKASTSFTIPEVPNLDSICKSFFSQAKHALQDLLDISSGFFGDELKRGFFSNLQETVIKK